MTLKTFAGDTLRRERRIAGLPQRALAERSGVCQTHVARIEAHRVQPTVLTLGHLLAALGVELSATETDPKVGGIATTVAERYTGAVRGQRARMQHV